MIRNSPDYIKHVQGPNCISDFMPSLQHMSMGEACGAGFFCMWTKQSFERRARSEQLAARSGASPECGKSRGQVLCKVDIQCAEVGPGFCLSCGYGSSCIPSLWYPKSCNNETSYYACVTMLHK